MAEEDAAIVTEIPGTTRDSIQRTIIIAGVPIHIVDTAGLRETTDIVEQKGIERTRAAIQDADILIRIIDSSRHQPNGHSDILQTFSINKPHLTIFNKIDLLNDSPRVESQHNQIEIHLSAKTGAGAQLLREKILEAVGWQTNQAGEGLFMARQRHLEALEEARIHLDQAETFTDHESNWVFTRGRTQARANCIISHYRTICRG